MLTLTLSYSYDIETISVYNYMLNGTKGREFKKFVLLECGFHLKVIKSVCPQKRDFIIEKHTARHFVQYCECLSTLLHFYATKIVNPFLNSRISAIHDKGLGIKPILKSLYLLMLL